MLDRVLQAEFPRRDKDGRDPELEALADHAAEDIGVLMGALEAGVVVELGVGGAAEGLPMGSQAGENPVGGGVPERPRGRQAPVERDAGEDIDERSGRQFEVLDHVKELDLGSVRGDVGEIPAGWGWGPADPLAAVDAPVAHQDAADGADRWDGPEGRVLERGMNGRRAAFAQNTLVAQGITEPQDAAFDGGGRAVGSHSAAGPLGAPIDLVQPVAGGPLNPDVDRADADVEAASYRAQYRPPSHRGDHRAPPSFQRAVLSIRAPRQESFPTTLTVYRMLSLTCLPNGGT